MKPDRSKNLLTPAPQISGLSLRPLTSGTYALLNRVGNIFVTPANPDQKPDHIWAALEWIFIHSAPQQEVLRVTHDSPDAFKAAVFQYSESVTVSSVPKLIVEIERALNAVHEQTVDVVPRHDSVDKDAPPNS
jgi:hypothetical protein